MLGYAGVAKLVASAFGGTALERGLEWVEPNEVPVDDAVLLAPMTERDLAELMARLYGRSVKLGYPHVREPPTRIVSVTSPKPGSGERQLADVLARSLASKGLRVAVIRPGVAGVHSGDSFDVIESLDLAWMEDKLASYDIAVWGGIGGVDPPWRIYARVVAVDVAMGRSAVGGYPGRALAEGDVTVLVNSSPIREAELGELKGFTVRASLSAHVPEDIKGLRTLVVEDPAATIFAGRRTWLGYSAARSSGALIVDPKPASSGRLRRIYQRYELGPVMPALPDVDPRTIAETIGAELVLCSTDPCPGLRIEIRITLDMDITDLLT